MLENDKTNKEEKENRIKPKCVKNTDKNHGSTYIEFYDIWNNSWGCRSRDCPFHRKVPQYRKQQKNPLQESLAEGSKILLRKKSLAGYSRMKNGTAIPMAYQIKNRWYYVGEDGAMCMDGWQTIDGQDYFFVSNGAMQTDEEIADILGEEKLGNSEITRSREQYGKTLEQNYTEILNWIGNK